MSIINLLANDSFIVCNKNIAKQYGINEALLLGELCSEYSYWEKENKLQNGWFFSTIDNVQFNTCLSGAQQRAALDHLTREGFLQTQVRGLPATRWIWLNLDFISERLLNDKTNIAIKAAPELLETVEVAEEVKEETNKPKKSKSKKSSTDSEGKTGDSAKSFKKLTEFINALNYPTEMKDALYKWYSTVAVGKCSIGQLKDKLIKLDMDCDGNLKIMENTVLKSYESNWFGFFPDKQKQSTASSNLVFSKNASVKPEDKEVVFSDNPEDVW